MFDSIYHTRYLKCLKPCFYFRYDIMFCLNVTLFMATSSQITAFCTPLSADLLEERANKINNTQVYHKKLIHGFSTLLKGVYVINSNKLLPFSFTNLLSHLAHWKWLWSKHLSAVLHIISSILLLHFNVLQKPVMWHITAFKMASLAIIIWNEPLPCSISTPMFC